MFESCRGHQIKHVFAGVGYNRAIVCSSKLAHPRTRPPASVMLRWAGWCCVSLILRLAATLIVRLESWRFWRQRDDGVRLMARDSSPETTAVWWLDRFSRSACVRAALARWVVSNGQFHAQGEIGQNRHRTERTLSDFRRPADQITLPEIAIFGG